MTRRRRSSHPPSRHRQVAGRPSSDAPQSRLTCACPCPRHRHHPSSPPRHPCSRSRREHPRTFVGRADTAVPSTRRSGGRGRRASPRCATRAERGSCERASSAASERRQTPRMPRTASSRWAISAATSAKTATPCRPIACHLHRLLLRRGNASPTQPPPAVQQPTPHRHPRRWVRRSAYLSTWRAPRRLTMPRSPDSPRPPRHLLPHRHPLSSRSRLAPTEMPRTSPWRGACRLARRRKLPRLTCRCRRLCSRATRRARQVSSTRTVRQLERTMPKSDRRAGTLE